MRLGIFGGTFDPVHYGHLLLAEWCRESCALDEVRFVPAAVAPHKTHQTAAGPAARVEMLKLAIGGHPAFVVSTIEIDRGGVSYTVDTLAEIRSRRPDAALFLLMGSDSLADLVNWREPARICELATPVVVHRGGTPPPEFGPLAAVVTPERLAMIAKLVVDMPQVELSSREIRRRAAEGKSIRYQTPRAVETYIETHALYRQPPTGAAP
ncbi:MAG: nicotinate (nicotinamide) nucleotide adenylyltransferase [Planctomycetota bacterium]|nr:MAG: nicotinate (nicotinamide) nucleotide adenylyltransferase [Planctomycetota bacterium]